MGDELRWVQVVVVIVVVVVFAVVAVVVAAVVVMGPVPHPIPSPTLSKTLSQKSIPCPSSKIYGLQTFQNRNKHTIPKRNDASHTCC